MSKDILYQPSLEYKKDYSTNGRYYEQSIEDNLIPEKNDAIKDKIDNITDITTDINYKVEMLPSNILQVFLPSYAVVKDYFDKIKDEYENKDYNDDNDNTSTSPDTSEPVITPERDPDDLPDPFEEDFGVILPIILPTKKPIIEELEDEYISDMLDIIEDYVKKYRDVVDKYIRVSLLTYHTSDRNVSLSMVNTTNLTNSDLSHLTDFGIKSNIALEQRLRLYKKLYPINKSIYHIKAAKIANEQRKRYKTIKKQEDVNWFTKSSNDILKESIKISEKKYEENFISLYKYLNSSVILFNECTSIVAKQKQVTTFVNLKERENE